MRAVLLPALLLAASLAGCSSPDAPAEAGESVTLVTDPSAAISMDAGPHLHDYWGGQRTLTVVDADLPSGVTWVSSTPISVATIRPQTGKVIPQGAGWVNVTVSWQENEQAIPANRYESPQLWVKSAADNGLVFRADLTENPATVAIPVTDEMADLPHQVLSAWQFDLYMRGTPVGTPPPAEGRWLEFSGTVHFTVTTDHTRNITLYPGHPDRWDGRTEILLFKGGGTLFYTGDPTNRQWSCFRGCPVVHVPENGTVIPYDADHVVVKVTQTNNPPFRLGLKYHGADSRDYAAPRAGPDDATSHTYNILVGGAGDGPYAKQSQWEFAPYPELPEENGWMLTDYTIEATVYRNA